MRFSKPEASASGATPAAELLTRNLLSVQKDLQARLDAATVTQHNFQRADDQASLAALYGIDPSGFWGRIANDRILYASALTAAQFVSITADLQQVAASADHAIYVALSQTHLVSGVSMIYQNHPLSREEASTSMALTHQGIHVSQDQILGEIGADPRRMYVDGNGIVRWGNPYETFVGDVNGSESNYTGFGTYYPPLVALRGRMARASSPTGGCQRPRSTRASSRGIPWRPSRPGTGVGTRGATTSASTAGGSLGSGPCTRRTFTWSLV